MLPNLKSVFEPIPEDWDENRLMRMRCDSQSMHFYGDISHYLVRRFTEFETMSVLDVGARTCAGTALLRLLHHPWAYTRLKFDPVVALDLEPDVLRFVQQEFHDIAAICDDIHNVADNSYDLVICSHTIEHLYEVQPFIAQLERAARRAVLVACPIDEYEPLTEGHFQRLTANDLEHLGFQDIEVYESFQFHNGKCGIAIKYL